MFIISIFIKSFQNENFKAYLSSTIVSCIFIYSFNFQITEINLRTEIQNPTLTLINFVNFYSAQNNQGYVKLQGICQI